MNDKAYNFTFLLRISLVSAMGGLFEDTASLSPKVIYEKSIA